MKKHEFEINLDILQEGFPAISKAIGRYLAEAGAFCMESNGHKSGLTLKVKRLKGDKLQGGLSWSNIIDQQTARAWNDTQEATEYGATAIAIALLQCLSGYTIIERSFKGTGFDYWLGTGEYDENLLPFMQRAARLEISGIWKERKGNTLRRRLKQKIKQVEEANYSDVPVVVIVVEFGTPKAKLFGI
jgi:hypothetical protein